MMRGGMTGLLQYFVANEEMVWRCLKVAVIAAAGIVACVAVFWTATISATVPTAELVKYTPDVRNGMEIFNIGGCASCHASPNQDPSTVNRTRLGGGLALKSPFGTFYVPNISPNLEDGIGKWSEADFVTALWEGASPSGYHLFPAFPYTSYRLMKFDDIRDLFVYMKTLPPVSGKVRGHDLAFPFNIRRLVGAWKLLFLRSWLIARDGPVRAAGGVTPQICNSRAGRCASGPRNIIRLGLVWRNEAKKCKQNTWLTGTTSGGGPKSTRKVQGPDPAPNEQREPVCRGTGNWHDTNRHQSPSGRRAGVCRSNWSAAGAISSRRGLGQRCWQSESA
jgi:mono/diheme cytochrome c family protein